MALDPHVRETFEATGERAVRASMNRRHPAVREWLEEKQAARARAKRLKRNFILSSAAVLFAAAATALVLLPEIGKTERPPDPGASADASLPSPLPPESAP